MARAQQAERPPRHSRCKALADAHPARRSRVRGSVCGSAGIRCRLANVGRMMADFLHMFGLVWAVALLASGLFCLGGQLSQMEDLQKRYAPHVIVLTMIFEVAMVA